MINLNGGEKKWRKEKEKLKEKLNVRDNCFFHGKGWREQIT
jgi:hypothetical protein